MRNMLLFCFFSALVSTALADTPQQTRMKACNADAAKQELKGDARKKFMSACLSAKKDDAKGQNNGAGEAGADVSEAAKKGTVAAGESPEKPRELTAQQQRMKTCNADAKAKSLSGQARKEFMKACLSGG